MQSADNQNTRNHYSTRRTRRTRRQPCAGKPSQNIHRRRVRQVRRVQLRKVSPVAIAKTDETGIGGFVIVPSGVLENPPAALLPLYQRIYTDNLPEKFWRFS